MTGIQDVEPGDYVKVGANRYLEIQSKWGVGPGNKLAKPSEGGFGVITTDGRSVGMYQALRYYKRGELPEGAV